MAAGGEGLDVFCCLAVSDVSRLRPQIECKMSQSVCVWILHLFWCSINNVMTFCIEMQDIIRSSTKSVVVQSLAWCMCDVMKLRLDNSVYMKAGRNRVSGEKNDN